MTLTSAPAAGFTPIPDALAELAAGRPVIVVDDEHRENEGDLILAAELVTQETMGFVVRHSSGVVCVPMSAEHAAAFRLPPMVSSNEDPKGTAYTISCDAVGVATGISAGERARTARLLAGEPDPQAITRPGHIFPLVAQPGGVRQRPGHTEAGVELARLAGCTPVAVIAELVHDDGEMMRLDALRDFAAEHQLALIAIDQLIDYLTATDPAAGSTPDSPEPPAAHVVPHTADVQLPTAFGDFTATAFSVHGHDHLLLRPSTPPRSDTPLVRVHSECLTGDVFGSYRCDCGEQLHAALAAVAAEGGAVVYLSGHEGRGIGLANKIAAYALQEQGLDTVDANRHLGFGDDLRDYTAAAEILQAAGLRRIRLLTNNPSKVTALADCGIEVTEQVPLEVPARPENAAYLATKRERMHHQLRFVV